MKKCRFCAEEILDDAMKCKHCGEMLNNASQSSLNNPSSQVSSAETTIKLSKTLLALILGYTGTLLLFLGVFMPMVRLPMVGTVSYFKNGQGDGVLVLIFAGLATLGLLNRKAIYTLIGGIVSGVMLLFTYINFQTKLEEITRQTRKQLSGNPFAGLSEAVIPSVQLEWGWALLILGVLLTIISAIIGFQEQKASNPSITPIKNVSVLQHDIVFLKNMSPEWRQFIFITTAIFIVGLLVIIGIVIFRPAVKNISPQTPSSVQKNNINQQTIVSNVNTHNDSNSAQSSNVINQITNSSPTTKNTGTSLPASEKPSSFKNNTTTITGSIYSEGRILSLEVMLCKNGRFVEDIYSILSALKQQVAQNAYSKYRAESEYHASKSFEHFKDLYSSDIDSEYQKAFEEFVSSGKLMNTIIKYKLHSSKIDPNGQYFFKEVHPGIYYLFVQHRGSTQTGFWLKKVVVVDNPPGFLRIDLSGDEMQKARSY